MKFENIGLPYPDFMLNEIIDPEEFDINNHTLLDAINELNMFVTSLIEGGGETSGASNISAESPFSSRLMNVQEALDEIVLTLSGQTGSSLVGSAPISGVNGVNVYEQLVSLKMVLDARMRGGDTSIKYEVYTIETANNGDNTFTYRNASDDLMMGELTSEGHQVFHLTDGTYAMGENRVEAFVQDTLHRSPASGGLREISPTSVALTFPEPAGTEITIKYFERIGLSGEHATSHGVGGIDEVSGLVHVGSTKPRSTKALWYQVVA